MWIHVFFVDGYPPLRVCLQTDGTTFFHAPDVGNFLGYKNASTFAFKYGKKHLGRNRVFTFGELMDAARRLPKSRLPLFRTIDNLWRFGYVDEPLPEYPGEVTIRVRSSGRLDLQQWIRQYVRLLRQTTTDVQTRFGRKRLEDDEKTRLAKLLNWVVEEDFVVVRPYVKPDGRRSTKLICLGNLKRSPEKAGILPQVIELFKAIVKKECVIVPGDGVVDELVPPATPIVESTTAERPPTGELLRLTVKKETSTSETIQPSTSTSPSDPLDEPSLLCCETLPSDSD